MSPKMLLTSNEAQLELSLGGRREVLPRVRSNKGLDFGVLPSAACQGFAEFHC